MNPPIELLKQYPAYLTLKHPLDAMGSGKVWDTAVALIMAANCTDKVVNKTLPLFLQTFPTWKEALGKTRDDLVPNMPGISHSGNKAEYILLFANYLEAHNGTLPATVAELTELKGFGRKTAGILLHVISGNDEAIPLDIHALRILDRLAWFPVTKNPLVREKQLLPLVPVGERFNTFTILTQHGRNICHARNPQCGDCKLKSSCEFYRTITA